MSAQLQVIAGPDQGRSFSLGEGQTLVIGRGQKTETRLRDPQVSREHCHVQADGGRFLVTDSGSAGGTVVNGKRITQHELKPGDVIQIGATQLRFQLEGAPEQSTLVTSPHTPPRPSRESAEQLEELAGKNLAHFAIESVAARGRTGIVFKARDTKEDRPVALKVMWPEFAQDEEEMQRFVRAMKTMLPLKHPNLVTVYAAGKAGPYCWISMEYVDGESLTQVIERIGIAGMLDWRQALRAAIHVARGLDYAHEHHVIHRNITPNNILVRSSDKLAKLGDLMLAKALEGTHCQQITRPGELIGDVAYMSPERTRGTAEIDSRSDIYSLGATVYALLTGRPPFDGGALVETITRIRSAEPAKPKKFQLSIPDLFEGTVLKMLAKRPEERHQTPAELLADLERVAKYQGVTV
jgi:serine/threonine protein kinase